MKNTILIILLFLSCLTYSQSVRDTIILKSGKIILPDRIIRVDKDSTVWYSIGYDNIKYVSKNQRSYYSDHTRMIPYTPPQKSIVEIKVDEVKDIKIRLQNFHDEIRWSQALYTASILLSIINVVNTFNNPSNPNTLYPIGSAVCGIGGTALYLHSYSYLNFNE